MCFKGALISIAVAAAAFLIATPLFAQHPTHAQNIPKVKVGSAEITPRPNVKITLEEDTAAVVKFCDRNIHPMEVQSYSQQFHWFIRKKVGEKRTKIVLTLLNPKVEFFKYTLSSIFLKAVADENTIRVREDKTPIKVFLHIPVKSLYDRNGLTNLEGLAVALVSYIGNDGIVSGVIFETTMIQTPIPAEGGSYSGPLNEAMSSTVVKFKKFLKSLQLTFGYELKMGLSLSTYNECITCFVSNVEEIISSFDFVVLNASIMEYLKAGKDNEEQEAYFRHCVEYLQKKYKQLEFYDVGAYFDFKN